MAESVYGKDRGKDGLSSGYGDIHGPLPVTGAKGRLCGR